MEILDPVLSGEALCAHAPGLPADPRSTTCEECGSNFNLRACAECGHVGCCESQAGHARAHALGQDHPVILQVVGGRIDTGFAWCYPENRYVR
jgi:CPA1 family monovalent cation:H+ antiporter